MSRMPTCRKFREGLAQAWFASAWGFTAHPAEVRVIVERCPTSFALDQHSVISVAAYARAYFGSRESTRMVVMALWRRSFKYSLPLRY